MKKSLYITIIATFVYVLFSLTSVYAESVIPMAAVTYRIENDGRYKSLKGVTYTSDSDSIDFTYKVTINETEKVYTASFVKNGNVFSYTYSGDKTTEDAYYQALLDNVAVETVFYAVGQANGISDDYLKDMAKDFSKYTYEKYGLEVKTYNYSNTIDGKAVSMKAIESFKIHADELSVAGTSTITPVVDENPPVEVEEKPSASPMILGVCILVIILVVVVLVLRSKKSATTKKVKKTK